MMNQPVFTADIESVLSDLRQVVSEQGFRGERILLTGGTGFFGKWMTQVLLAHERSVEFGQRSDVGHARS